MPTPPTQWSRDDCASYLSIAPNTWSSYVSRRQAPQPAGHVGGSPWWRPEDVKAWNDTRRGPGNWGPHKTTPKES